MFLTCTGMSFKVSNNSLKSNSLGKFNGCSTSVFPMFTKCMAVPNNKPFDIKKAEGQLAYPQVRESKP